MEEKIEVGEYGRTNYGKIIKFAWIERSNGKRDESKVILIDGDIVSNNFFYFHVGENIVKHSKQLIDLIEVGDIVYIKDVLHEDITYIWSEDYLKALKEDIQNGIKLVSILTKERYMANFYKVGGRE